MNYRLHENGWTVMLEDFDLKQATQDDINQIAKLLATNTVVVARGQNLSVDDEVKIARMFKNPEQFYHDDVNHYHSYFKGAEIPESDRYLLRVTGEKNEEGLTGIAGWEEEMQWHCNDHSNPNRRSLIWLYSVRGSKGSRTTWNNNILSYNELDEERRKPLENLKLIERVYIANDLDDPDTSQNNDYIPSLVIENIAGKKGFYFPFLQYSGFVGMSKEESKEIFKWLSEYTVQDKFCYHHDWEDGDIVIAEQWLGIHKRWPFKSIEKRLLHRAAFDFPDQDYR